jgi:cold shock protein
VRRTTADRCRLGAVDTTNRAAYAGQRGAQCLGRAAAGLCRGMRRDVDHLEVEWFKETGASPLVGETAPRRRIDLTLRTGCEMGKGRDRGPRRRGFEDDSYSEPPARDQRPSFRRGPRESAAPSGPPIDAFVKWFNADKGFGFVELADGSGDAFLHVAVLQAAGHDAVQPETKLSVQVGQGQKGRQVTAVLALDASAGETSRAVARPSPSGPFGRERPDPATAAEIEGTVKWFNPEKGFGFVVCEDRGKDVFVHASVVERAGLRGLEEGQRLAMKVVKTQKGREAISLTLLD